jgi:O-antigen ligase
MRWIPLSHRSKVLRGMSPVGVVIAATCGALLWHGGFRAPAQLSLAGVGVAAVLLWPTRWATPRLLAIGLSVTAAANVLSLVVNGGSIGGAAAATAVPLLLAVAAADPNALRRLFLPAVALTAATIATAGLAGLALHLTPLAEQIAGLWRAGSTLEYPPALGLLCVCGLAAVLCLHALGEVDLWPALMAGALVVAGAAATIDRVAAVEVLAVLAFAAVRLPAARKAACLLAAGAVAAGGIALVLADGDRAGLERHLRHGPVSSRQSVWEDAADAIGERPLLGRGPGAFAPLQAERNPRHPAYAHNAVLEQGVDAGIPGAAGTALALVAMLTAGLAGLATRDPFRLGAGAIASAVALSGLYDFTWSYAPIVALGAIAALAAWATPAPAARPDRAAPAAAPGRPSTRSTARRRARGEA